MKKRPSKPARDESDERVQRSKKAVLTAAFQLLTEAGYSGVTVDEVSKRSGVAKTTIYRHWPSREKLLISACSIIHVKPEPPDTGSLKGDLEQIVPRMATNLRTGRWTTALPSIIDAGERDPEVAELQAEIHAKFMSALRFVIERAQERGELSKSRQTSEYVAAVAGPLFYRRFISREPLDERLVWSVVDLVVRAGKG
jgi:AcrR family transcriptional regulator